MFRPLLITGAILAAALPAVAQDATSIEDEFRALETKLRSRVDRSKRAAHLQSMNEKLKTFIEKWEPRAAEGRSRLPIAKAHMFKGLIARGKLKTQLSEFKEATAHIDAFLEANPGDKAGEALKDQLAKFTKSVTDRAAAVAKRKAMIGAAAAEIEIDEVLDGEEGVDLHLAALKGKVVILDFWATWCGPCRVTIPHLIALKKKYGDDLVILGMTRFYTYGVIPAKDGGRPERKQKLKPDEEREVNRKCVEIMGINYPVVFSKTAGKKYLATAIPQLVLIDKAGKVRKIHVGSRDLESVDKAIEECMAESGS